MATAEKEMSSYNEDTDFIYGVQTWGPLYKEGDGVFIDSADNKAEKYIRESLEIMKLTPADLKDKHVFNIGTGRESRVFLELGAKFVTHFDISKDSVRNVQRFIAENNISNMESINGDVQRTPLPKNQYDVIFLAGIYQHIEVPAIALVNLINALKPSGLMYMGFYRSGEWKYFIVDSIRYLLEKRMFALIKEINTTLYTFGQASHYQNARLLDDFFVPCKHNFHPKDVMHDIELLGAEVYYFDGDVRDYNHEGTEYFSIGGDRIYITKKKDSNVQIDDVVGKLRTKKGRDQLKGVEYDNDLINENISLIKNIKSYQEHGFVSDLQVASLCIGLYQFTRPYIPKESEYFQKSIKEGRHKTLNQYLKNFIQEVIKKT